MKIKTPPQIFHIRSYQCYSILSPLSHSTYFVVLRTYTSSWRRYSNVVWTRNFFMQCENIPIGGFFHIGTILNIYDADIEVSHLNLRHDWLGVSERDIGGRTAAVESAFAEKENLKKEKHSEATALCSCCVMFTILCMLSQVLRHNSRPDESREAHFHVNIGSVIFEKTYTTFPFNQKSLIQYTWWSCPCWSSLTWKGAKEPISFDKDQLYLISSVWLAFTFGLVWFPVRKNVVRDGELWESRKLTFFRPFQCCLWGWGCQQSKSVRVFFLI